MKKRSDEKTDEKMTGGDAASVREHVLSPEEYLSQIEFLDDDFEFQHKDGFEHVDTNFASQSYWKEAIARFKKNKGAMFSFVCILFLIVMALVGPHMNQFTYDQQIITNQNMAPRVPGLENMGILDGSETIRTSTGSKEINYYESNSLTDTYYWFGSDSLGRDLERNADQPLCSGSGGIHRPCVWSDVWTCIRIFRRKSRYDHAAYRRDTKQYSVPDHGYPAFVSHETGTYVHHVRPDVFWVAGHEPNRPRGGLKAERAGICACFPDAGSKEFPHYFQRDFTKYFWSSDYTDDVLDPACDLYRGILSLYWLGCAGADGFAGFPDFEWISELYKPSVHDRVPVNCHGTSDAVL